MDVSNRLTQEGPNVLDRNPFVPEGKKVIVTGLRRGKGGTGFVCGRGEEPREEERDPLI